MPNAIQAMSIDTTTKAPGSVVKISGNSFVINGKPMRVNGVAGSYSPESLALLKSWGGNTIRTYSQTNLRQVLDMAWSQGLFVIVGMSSGLKSEVNAEIQRLLKLVDQYKDHPAVLCWNIGNEQEHDFKNDTATLTGMVPRLDAIARAIKAKDPNHPVINTFIDFGQSAKSVVLAGLKKGTALDAIGINTYTSAPSLADRYASWKLSVPFVVTELGWSPALMGRQATWVDPTWPDARIITFEKTSGEKATHIGASLRSMYASRNCLGTTIFRWEEGNKPAGTWHMIFTESMKRTAIADELIRAWTGGRQDPGQAPQIVSTITYLHGQKKTAEKAWKGIQLAGVDATHQTTAGASVTATIALNRSKGVMCTWLLKKHNFRQGRETIQGAVIKQLVGGTTFSFSAPPTGIYRVYVYAEDSTQGSVAYASIPFRVT